MPEWSTWIEKLWQMIPMYIPPVTRHFWVNAKRWLYNSTRNSFFFSSLQFPRLKNWESFTRMCIDQQSLKNVLWKSLYAGPDHINFSLDRHNNLLSQGPLLFRYFNPLRHCHNTNFPKVSFDHTTNMWKILMTHV